MRTCSFATFCLSGELSRKIFCFFFTRLPFPHSVLLDTHLSLVMAPKCYKKIVYKDVDFITLQFADTSVFSRINLLLYLQTYLLFFYSFCLHSPCIFERRFPFCQWSGSKNRISSLHLGFSLHFSHVTSHLIFQCAHTC